MGVTNKENLIGTVPLLGVVTVYIFFSEYGDRWSPKVIGGVLGVLAVILLIGLIVCGCLVYCRKK